MLNAAKTHDEVSVVCDQLGTPTSAVELSKMIHFLEGTEEYGIYHATCEGDTNWAEFTEAFYKKCDIKTKVNHVTSEEYAKINPVHKSMTHSNDVIFCHESYFSTNAWIGKGARFTSMY